MTFSRVLRLKLGPFWRKTSFLLVNVVPFGNQNATYVLRVDRPAVFGGRIELPIGQPDFPVNLLPRSANDCRKLRFTIRCGVKGKSLRFLAPNAAVYRHWIKVLRQASEGNTKITKRLCNKIGTVVASDGRCDTDNQHTGSSNFMHKHRGSDQIDTLSPSCSFCSQCSNTVLDISICTNNTIIGICSAHDAHTETHDTASEKPREDSIVLDSGIKKSRNAN